MAGNGVHQWKHNWIPLTPAAALVKAKGSKTTAAKLRARHGVKSSSTRDVVRASRQTSIPEPSGRQRSPETLAREARMAEDARLRRNADVVARTRPTPSSGDLSDAAAIFKARNPGKPIAGNEREVSRIADDLWRAKRLRSENTGNTPEQTAAERERIRAATKVGSPEIAARLAAEKAGTRPKTTEDLLREADAQRTKPLDMTTKRKTELAEKGGPGLARDVSRGSRVTLPDGRKVTAFDVAVDRDKGKVTIFPAQRDIDAGAPRQITVDDNARVTVEPKSAPTDDLAAARARRASEQSSRAAQLRDQAAAERAKLQGIADRAGPPTTDPQANRLSARGLKQAHRNTDSSLRRYTETQQRANALESQAHLAEARAKEAGRTRLTRADVEGATHIVDQHGQPREVVRVNAKTVTVKTPYSWTETVPIEKIRRAIKATPEQIAEARRRAALRK